MLALDHLIVGCANAKQKSEESSLIVVQGGTHEQWGTYNYLGYLKNACYVEWLSPFDYNKAREAENPLIHDLLEHLSVPSAGNAMQFALRTENMDSYIEHFRRQSIPFTGPYPGSRVRKDGTKLEWRMLFPIGETEFKLPFLIEWDGTGNTAPNAETVNPLSIQTVQFGVKDVEHARQKMEWIYGLDKTDDGSWGLTNAKLELTTGNGLSFSIG
ncbi:VOC family protein [Sediminibacillus halophilus]|uniref:Glyoxalase-like domain-containing protein n=1 Tax=Sediminibacillus halophilus TaxID=482461 RepID=A0A1G9WT09_9BACI|nr:VOC family protein [Sediminibacillus halophilus]SDM87519.1 Glyoxalase-like domain-containing protein [Sediminibacillus halophilus]